MMDRISAYRELIRKNIDYENYPPIYNKQEVDELIELIVETLMLPPDAGTIRIGGKERPVPIVKSMFLKLDKDHICYILKCLHNTCDINQEYAEFSYPAIIAEGNEVYITYTWKRKTIAFWHIRIN